MRKLSCPNDGITTYNLGFKFMEKTKQILLEYDHNNKTL